MNQMKIIDYINSKPHLIFLFLVWVSFCSHAQIWQKVELAPEFSSTNFSNIHFINDDEGLIIGVDGTILKTFDGGFEWTEIEAGAIHVLNDMTFANEDVGYINGLKTTDGGDTWVTQSATKDFKFMHAITEDHLIANFAFGANSYHESFDGGDTWIEVQIPTLPDMNLYTYTPNDYAQIDEDIAYLSLRKA